MTIEKINYPFHEVRFNLSCFFFYKNETQKTLKCCSFKQAQKHLKTTSTTMLLLPGCKSFTVGRCPELIIENVSGDFWIHEVSWEVKSKLEPYSALWSAVESSEIAGDLIGELCADGNSRLFRFRKAGFHFDQTYCHTSLLDIERVLAEQITEWLQVRPTGSFYAPSWK